MLLTAPLRVGVWSFYRPSCRETEEFDKSVGQDGHPSGRMGIQVSALRRLNQRTQYLIVLPDKIMPSELSIQFVSCGVELGK